MSPQRFNEFELLDEESLDLDLKDRSASKTDSSPADTEKEMRELEFSIEKESILMAMSVFIEEKRYGEAIELAQIYKEFRDPDLLRLYAEADKLERRRAEKDRLLAALEQIPFTHASKRLAIYRRLLELEPDNPEYQRQAENFPAQQLASNAAAKVGQGVSWAVSVIFLLAAMGALMEYDFILGSFSLAIGLLNFPPLINYCASKTTLRIPLWLRVTISFILFIILGTLL